MKRSTPLAISLLCFFVTSVPCDDRVPDVECTGYAGPVREMRSYVGDEKCWFQRLVFDEDGYIVPARKPLSFGNLGATLRHACAK